MSIIDKNIVSLEFIRVIEENLEAIRFRRKIKSGVYDKDQLKELISGEIENILADMQSENKK